MAAATPTFAPKLIFYPVNKQVLQRESRRFIYMASASLGTGAVGTVLSRIWDNIPGAMEFFDIQDNLVEARPLLFQGILFTALGLFLMLTIYMELLDAQMFFSLSKLCLSLGVLATVCAILSLFDNINLPHLLFALLVLLFVVYRFLATGVGRFYLQLKSYGDYALHVIMLVIFLLFSWVPVSSMME